MYNILITIHVLAATIWAGGHLILSIVYLPKALITKDTSTIRNFEKKYELIGIPSLIIHIATGIWLSFVRIPNFFDWFDFSYFVPVNITIKLGLIIITLLLALDARLRIIPKLGKDNIVQLAFHIIPVTIIAVLLVIIGVSFRYGGLF
jgi:putative copper export protein